jgi:hypothetical protein
MAARRLPWIKLWIEGMAHEKIALLTDAQFRTWVLVLCAGSQQPIRWRFASSQHAAVITGRPVQHIKQLVSAHLLDPLNDGLWVHDFRRWQEVYESDLPLNGKPERTDPNPPTPSEHSPEHSDQRSANAPPNTAATLPARPRAPASDGRRETKDVRPETGDLPQPGSEEQQGGGLGGAAAPPAPAADFLADELLDRVNQALTGQPGWAPTEHELIKLRDLAERHGLDLEVEAMKIANYMHKPRRKDTVCNFRYVANWLEKGGKNGATRGHSGEHHQGSGGSAAGAREGPARRPSQFAEYVIADRSASES